MRVLPEIEVEKLPNDVRANLALLDLELSEGDITEKGYEKKRRLLLGPYIQAQLNGGFSAVRDIIGKANRRKSQRLTRNETRYHSEIRLEAVQQALADWNVRGERHAANKRDVATADGTSKDTENTSSMLAVTPIQPNRRRRTTSPAEHTITDASVPTKNASQSAKNSDSSSDGEDSENVNTEEMQKVKMSRNSVVDQSIPTKKSNGNELEYENLRENTPARESATPSKMSQRDSSERAEPCKLNAIASTSSPTPNNNNNNNNAGNRRTPLKAFTKADLPIQLRKSAERGAIRSSPVIQRSSVLVLEDRPLPELPADASDLSEQEEEENATKSPMKLMRNAADSFEHDGDAAYINTRTSTNDSGLGGSSKAPQEYANTNFREC